MELFYDTNMKKVRQDVIDIYIRNNLANKDRHDILNITVSLDGSTEGGVPSPLYAYL